MSRKIRQRIYINLFIFIVLLVVLLIDNRKKVSFEFGQDDLQIYKELEGKSVVEDFFYVDGSYAGENLFIQSPIFTLDRGIYTISVKYEEGQCRATSYAELSGRRYSWNDVKSDSNILDSSGNVTYNIYVKRNNCEMRIRNSFTEPGDNGYLLIRNISVRSFRNQPVIYILIWVAAAVLVNAALSLKNSKKWQSDGNLKITVFWGFVIILISSYPVFADYMLQGHDMDFHLFRIEGLKTALEAGIFPAKIQPLWRDNSGYAVGVFYPDLFLYFPAVLRLAGVPIYLAYNSYILLMNVMTTCITYASFKRISDNKTGMLASMFYTLFPYRLMNIYVRSAVGEYTAMTFFPLVFCGLYEIYSYSEEGGNKERGGYFGAVPW